MSKLKLDRMLSAIYSFLPNFIKSLLSLGLIKSIAIFGGAGSLAAWGNVQNLTAIISSAGSLSVQTGVTAQVASGRDNYAFERSILLTFAIFTIITLISGLEYLTSFYLLSIPLYKLLLPSLGLAFMILVSSWLVAKAYIMYLCFFYGLSGTLLITTSYFLGGWNESTYLIAVSSSSWAPVLLFYIVYNKELRFFEVFDGFLEKSKKLISYGLSSFVNAAVITFVYIYLRQDLLSIDGKMADNFEGGLRLITALEIFLVMPIQLYVFKRLNIVQGNAAYKEAALGVALLIIPALIVFFFIGDFIITLLLSEKYIVLTDVLASVLFVVFMKAFLAIITLKMMLKGVVLLLVIRDVLSLSIFLIAAYLSEGVGSISVEKSFLLLATFFVVAFIFSIFSLIRDRIRLFFAFS